jgi:sugar transferase (PEP-CTERM system associated)
MIRLFRVFIPANVLVLILCDFLIGFGCFALAGYLVYDGDFGIYLRYEGGFLRVVLVVISLMAILYFQDLYKSTGFGLTARSVLVYQVIVAIGTLFVTQAMLAYVNRDLMVSRYILLAGGAIYVLVEPMWRRAYTSFIYKGLGVDRILFLGTSPTVQKVISRLLEYPELGLYCVGIVDNSNPKHSIVAGAKVLGCISELKQIVNEYHVDRIVVGMAERRAAMPVEDLLDLRFSGIRIEEASLTYETIFGRVCTHDLRPAQLIFGTELGPRRRSLKLQLIYSTIIAAIGLLIFAPVMILVAIAVKLTSPGPILFRQTRVGMNGIPFTVLKFRSMVADAEAKTGAVWASRSDPRVTKIGRFLRKTRLDELPQLFNVLRGDMSIVGPRPERPEFVKTLSEVIPFYLQRHYVRPGITGWAQINYKYGETIEDTIMKLEYDLYYIKNVSLSLDMYVMFHTVKVMLFSGMGQ